MSFQNNPYKIGLYTKRHVYLEDFSLLYGLFFYMVIIWLLLLVGALDSSDEVEREDWSGSCSKQD